MLSIEFALEQIEAAQSWHGGQSSMLYAVASTGKLALGSHRPEHYPRNGGTSRPMTDTEWMIHLASELQAEADEAADLAADGLDDEPEAEETLRSIATTCRRTIETLRGLSRG